MTRFVLGVLLCALAYPGAILVLASEHWAVWFSVVIAGVFTVSGSALLALLILTVLRRKSWLRWWQLLAVGALIGGILPFLILPVLVLALPGRTGDLGPLPDFNGVLLTFTCFAVLGAVHALVLWVIAVARNPWFGFGPRKRLNDT
jgi:hypothetical protein